MLHKLINFRIKKCNSYLFNLKIVKFRQEFFENKTFEVEVDETEFRAHLPLLHTVRIYAHYVRVD